MNFRRYCVVPEIELLTEYQGQWTSHVHNLMDSGCRSGFIIDMDYLTECELYLNL